MEGLRNKIIEEWKDKGMKGYRNETKGYRREMI